MRLKSITLHGFKSFSNRTDIPLGQGITAIVGPNGCGKSNVSDGIRWVLGEPNVRNLRGENILDVIFKGAGSAKPSGFAEVDLLIDNDDHALPMETAEVSIARRVYRSGDSDFLINGHACRLKDIRNLFLGTGLGSHGYSVIERQMVEEVLSDRDDQRRLFFEEAAGISRYKLQRREAMRKLEATEQDLMRIADIVREIEREVALPRPAGRQGAAASAPHGRDPRSRGDAGPQALDGTPAVVHGVHVRARHVDRSPPARADRAVPAGSGTRDPQAAVDGARRATSMRRARRGRICSRSRPPPGKRPRSSRPGSRDGSRRRESSPAGSRRNRSARSNCAAGERSAVPSERRSKRSPRSTRRSSPLRPAPCRRPRNGCGAPGSRLRGCPTQDGPAPRPHERWPGARVAQRDDRAARGAPLFPSDSPRWLDREGG